MKIKRIAILVLAFIFTLTFITSEMKTNAQPNETTVAANSLNVRTGPGLSFDVIDSLKHGEQVEIISTSGDWLKVKYKGRTGWIASWLTTTNKQGLNMQTEIVSQTDALNFRASPSVNAPILTRMNAGDKATLISREGEWVFAQFNGTKGWVHQQFISEVTAQQVKSKEQPQSFENYESFTVLVDALNVRKKADLSSKKITTIHNGETFPVQQIEGNWVQLKIDDKKDGWVYSFHGELTHNKASQSKTYDKNRKVTVLTNGTNIRESATTSSSIVSRANAGEQFTIKEEHGDWYEVILSNDQSAFIAKWVVSIEGDALTPTSTTKKPKRVPGTLKGLTIVVDPGHGGNDRGTTGARGTLEKTITLKTAELLVAKLQAAGATVHLTRDSDNYVSLQKRVWISQQQNADAFISIHYDANPDSSISGFTTYYQYRNQAALAKSINNGLQSSISLRNRGAQPGNYYVLRENRQNAVLVELGFLSNPSEELTVDSNRFRDQATYGIYKGILNYFDASSQ
ncbi:N-acetylmuramoyl-L-alanine amidase [Sporosarcina ureilytica]|uniref:SH3b domain-containing protein n=1 Tax=Sporosarcina ureilytica TaxID=298596 RepID=A0A1D8JG00_9BACL|nr:N-acetylmuramoyl-L-alanine amidase [Sporosarcina ureilytica]AOV07639.1 hypothetical protein BI350_08885 [Sporosarcina ureilytica]